MSPKTTSSLSLVCDTLLKKPYILVIVKFLRLVLAVIQHRNNMDATSKVVSPSLQYRDIAWMSPSLQYHDIAWMLITKLC